MKYSGHVVLIVGRGLGTVRVVRSIENCGSKVVIEAWAKYFESLTPE